MIFKKGQYVADGNEGEETIRKDKKDPLWSHADIFLIIASI